jgi:drug/metabolite transporter (DMT)-like permease
MKNKAGKILGFVFGFAGFLLLFKFIFLDRIPKEDEVPPGAVLIAAIVSGIFFGFIGSLIQNYIAQKKNYK